MKKLILSAFLLASSFALSQESCSATNFVYDADLKTGLDVFTKICFDAEKHTISLNGNPFKIVGKVKQEDDTVFVNTENGAGVSVIFAINSSYVVMKSTKLNINWILTLK